MSARGRLAGRRGLWVTLSLLLVAVGVGASVLAAHLVARSEMSKARLAFSAESAQITSTLRLAIQHEQDLEVGGRAFVSRNPGVSRAAFDEWGESNEAFQRFPELQDIGLIVPVSLARLDGFRRHMLVNPVLPPARQPAGLQGTFLVLPQGRRPIYCFAFAGLVRHRVATLPPGLDYCAAEPSLMEARDTGLSSYAPFQEGSSVTLAVQTPVYRRHMALDTEAARRRAFIGWLAESLMPQVVLATALQGHQGTAVSLRYRSRLSEVAFTSGAVAAGASSLTTSLHNGWTVTSFGEVAAAGMFASGRSLTLLLGGSALSVLLSLLIFVLGTGRTRALSLVREKTRELSYVAHHDGLTGLFNRAQVIERTEQMLARTRREPRITGAALFLDIDGFKHVNDSLGHAAGDELLKLVSERLVAQVREQDTVGRLGGDEFVVVIESTAGEEGADCVAERVLQALREPVALAGYASDISISASVGIAIGPRESADALLRDADLALYAAKDSGRDRYILFDGMRPAEPSRSPSR